MSLWKRLESLQPSDEKRREWRPRIFDAAREDERLALEGLIEAGEVRTVEDGFLVQLRELAETRRPEAKNDKAALDQDVERLVGDADPLTLGRWVFYPWSGRLLHVLAEAEFSELRTSRNRYKITADEQAHLASLTIGVVGLSVGHATALTLALEGLGGELRLADFDTLSLSNLNRLRTGLHQLGVNKAVLTAREILELNPYARLRLFEDGIHEENVEAFLNEGGKLDVLIEECDDLYLKIFLRERARDLRIPVLMETSDRGLIDVERFDLEPERPLLHGLIGDTRAESLKGLATADKVPFVLDILGIDTLSTRFTASLVEIDRTLKTWPQLASGVALGGALNADTVRRIALGEFRASGRYYVDLEKLISEPASRPFELKRERTSLPRPPPPTAPMPRAVPKRDAGWRERILHIAETAALAPSGGNTQPWRFEGEPGRLRCELDPARAATFLDFQQTASLLACGAAAENALIGAAELGLAAKLTWLPDEASVWTLELTEDPSLTPVISEVVRQRVTNRKHGHQKSGQAAFPEGKSSLSPFSALEEAAASRGASLRLVTSKEDLQELGRILGAGDRVRILHRRLHDDMMGEVRWTKEEVEATRDGLDIASLELSPTDEAGLRVSSSWPAMAFLARLGEGRALEEQAQKALAASSAAGLLLIEGDSKERWLEAGRAVQAVWHTAQALGLALQPWSALPYLIARHHAGGEGLSDGERRTLASLDERLDRLFPRRGEASRVFLFRLSEAAPPTVRSLRRPIEDVFRFR